MPSPLARSTFTQVFIGIVLTSTIVLSIAQIISYLQLKKSFDQYATKQVIVLREIGQNVLIKENYTLPADFETFINDYRQAITSHTLFAFGVGVAASLIAGLILSSQITNPIAKLRNTIKGVTKSGYSLKAPEVGSIEIQELIHEFNQLILQLKEQEQLRQELLANVSHELKTPITKIRGQIEGMLDGVYPTDELNIRKVHVNLEQLEYLIQALYEVNRLTPQDVTLHVQPLKIAPIISQALAGYTKKPIKFVVTADPKLTVKADPYRIRQIIDNLVSNAYKFTSSGQITITANKKIFMIQDTGPGIAPEHLGHIFERLYRAEKSRSRQTGGLGLGLYIVKQLVTLHGWTIAVESQVGKGTIFTIDWHNST